MKMKTTTNDRYVRQTMLPQIGAEGQQRLRNSSVLIVGLGGLGSAVATYLAGAGVGTLGLADADTVSLSNLQRQTLYTEAQIGTPKTDAARDRLAAMSSDVVLRLHPEGITPENAEEIIAGYDLVVDCCDNFPTRYLIDDVCTALGKPWVYGSIGEFHGQVSVFNHTTGRRYAELYPMRDELCALPRTTAGVIGTVPGFIGCLEASEAIKVITGAGETLEGRLFTIDMLTMHSDTFTF